VAQDIISAKEPCTGTAQSAKPLTMTPKVFFRWVAWLLVLAIAVLTLAPIALRPVTGAPVSLERFVAFAAIGAAFCLGYPKHRLYIVVLLVGIIGFLEIAQNIVSGRHGRLPDGLVKTSGALLGVAFASFIARYSGFLNEARKGEKL
jgi:VanZ family protein